LSADYEVKAEAESREPRAATAAEQITESTHRATCARAGLSEESDVARTRKKTVWGMVLACNLGCIDEERVLHPGSEPKNNLLNELQCPAADEVLIALRKSFSLTFPRNPFVVGLQQALTEIRQVGVEALKEIPEVLQELSLPAVPGSAADASKDRAIVFKFSLVRLKDLEMQVQYEGKTRSLVKLLDPCPADELVRTLRHVISDTFSEMHDEEQHEQVLSRIRDRIWDTLPAFNDLLFEIEIEPIAERREAEDTEEENFAEGDARNE
jgi:hypothetical protein